MSRNKRKEQKRREEYNKAVKHKMESAADLADKYARAYDSDRDKNSAYKRNKRIVNRKLLLILCNIVCQAILLFAIILLVFLPLKNNFKSVLNNYFSDSEPQFTEYGLSNEFIGSENESNAVYFTDIEEPDLNSYYAVISSEKFSCKVYYGLSEQALTDGVCHISATDLPGVGRPTMIYGYSSTHLVGAVETLKEGDIVTYTTNYGVYRYQVTSCSILTAESELPYDIEEDKEQLIICTDYPFGRYKTETGKTYCILADKVSGPEVVK